MSNGVPMITEPPVFIPPDTPVPRPSWWLAVYKAGVKADIDGLPRVAPEGLTAEQKWVWEMGYDR